MTLIELKEHLEEMLLNDIDPNTPVCIPMINACAGNTDKK